MPNFYHSDDNPQPTTATSRVDIIDNIPSLNVTSAPAGNSNAHKSGNKHKKFRTASEEWEAKKNAESEQKTDAEEVWFAGCHCDVGGGSVRNGTRHSLARIPLRWMIRECFRTKTGIIFDKEALREVIGIDSGNLYPVVKERPKRLSPGPDVQLEKMEAQPNALFTFVKILGSIILIPFEVLFAIVTWPIKHAILFLKFTPASKSVRKFFKAKSNKANPEVTPVAAVPETISAFKSDPFVSEEMEDLKDAVTPIYDQLSIHWYWWIIELIPMRFRSQKGRRDDFFVRANVGTGRKIYGDALVRGLKVHQTVKTRLEVLDSSGKSAYTPKAWFRVRDPVSNKKVDGPTVWNVSQDDPQCRWKWVS